MFSDGVTNCVHAENYLQVKQNIVNHTTHIFMVKEMCLFLEISVNIFFYSLYQKKSLYGKKYIVFNTNINII